MKVLAIVPAFNEEENIVSVVHSLEMAEPAIDVVLINDGSADRTAERAESTGHARVVNLACNLGIGGAVQTGFKYAWREGYEIAIQFDGDGQHIAAEIPSLVAPIQRGEADVVIGSRFCQKRDNFKPTPARRTGILIMQILNSLLLGQRVTDNTSGFRAYNRRAIGFLAQNYPTDYPEPEAVVLLGRNGFVLREVFVTMRQRQGGTSSISGLRSAYYMIKVILAVIMTSLRSRTERA